MLVGFSITGYAENIFKPSNQQAFDNFSTILINQAAEATMKGKNANPFLIDNVVTASKVIADFKANQLKANKTYKDKDTRIQSVASKINAGVLNQPYISANGKNRYESILIYIDPKDERFLDITAGDKIDLICKGNGVKLEWPSFNRCIFTQDYLDKAKPILYANLRKTSENNYKPKYAEEFKMILLYAFLEPVIQEDCAISAEECGKALNKDRKEDPKITPRIQKMGEYYRADPLPTILSKLH